ncbi:TolC family protein [Acidobacteria bacterium AH-259-O06]|nr:TolC family protein [Acidobacteria bacterium AH-259-O06]
MLSPHISLLSGSSRTRNIFRVAKLVGKFFCAFLLQSVVVLAIPLSGPPVLRIEEALQLYIDRSPAVRAEKERVEMASSRLNQAGLLPNPQLNFSQEGFPVGRPDSSYLNDQEFLIWATQELELGGKRRHRKRVASFDVQATEADLQNFIRLGKATVKEAFVRAYRAQQKLGLAQEHLDSYYEIRDIHRKRVEAGDAAGLSQLRIDMEEVHYITAVNEAGTNLASAWAELAALITWEGLSMPTLQPTIGAAPLERSMEELRALALESRPDLRRETIRAAQGKALVDLQESRTIPNLTFGGGYKRDFGTNSFYFALHLPLPLFNRNQGNIEEALARVRRNQNLLSWKRLQIRAEVERAFKTYQLQEANVKRLEQTVIKRAANMAEVTLQSYLEGEASLLEYLDALRVKLDASLGFYELLFQLGSTRIELEKSVGAELK